MEESSKKEDHVEIKPQIRQVMLESWGVSQKGTEREENQDAFLNWPEMKLWAVADGLGGSEFGGEASKTVANFLMQIQASDNLDDHVNRIREQVILANDMLRSHETLKKGTAATTLVCLAMHDGAASCLWSGDSRCYLLRAGVLYQCTKDHTVRQQKIDSGELTVHEAHRMVKGHLITNAIGVTPEVKLEEVRLKIMAGDRFLLCSDGLTGLMDHETLASHMTKYTAKDCVESIMQAVEHMTQPDNITVIVVSLSGRPLL